MNRGRSSQSRRAFLWASGVWTIGAGVPQLGAEETADRVLVCVYLLTGNTGAEFILPLDPSSLYSKRRGKSAGELLALPADPVTNVASTYGLHPSLIELRELYTAGAATIAANVGSSGGSSAEQRYQAMRFLPGGFLVPGWAPAGTYTAAVLPSEATVASRSAADAGSLGAAAATANFNTAFPGTRIGRQLREIAGVIRVRKTFGLQQPVLTAVMGGFQFNQPAQHAARFRDLSQALAAFYQATVEMGVSRQVIAYTDMDYGAHASREGRGQIVIGGSVGGGRVFETPGSTMPYEQYIGTMRRWLGAPPNGITNSALAFLR